MDIKLALKSMGYRPLSETIWAKPMGYSVLIVNCPTLKWTQLFHDITGKTCVWDSSIYEPPFGEFVEWLAYTECYCYHAISGNDNMSKHWGWTSSDDKLDLILKKFNL